jgi:hypothetical protein
MKFTRPPIRSKNPYNYSGFAICSVNKFWWEPIFRPHQKFEGTPVSNRHESYSKHGFLSHLCRSNLKLDGWDLLGGFKYDGGDKYWGGYKFWGGFWILKESQFFNAGIFTYFIVIFQLQYDGVCSTFIYALRSNSILDSRYCHRWRLIVNIKN